MADKPNPTTSHPSSYNQLYPVDLNNLPVASPACPSSSWPAFSHTRPALYRPPTDPMASHSHYIEQPAAPMASVQPKETSKLDINSLMSPPDPVLDSFNQSKLPTAANAHNGQSQSFGQPLPMSPPISPYSKPISSNNAPNTPSTRLIDDPVLYPTEGSSPSSLEGPPLFAPTDREDHKRFIHGHVRSRSSNIFNRVSPPRVEEYELVLTFRSQIMKLYMKDKIAYFRRERAYLQNDKEKAQARRFQSIAPAKPVPKPLRVQRADRVTKPQASGPSVRSIRINANNNINNNNNNNNDANANANSTINVNINGGPGASPKNGGSLARSAIRLPSVTPEPSRRIVAPNREDKDFAALADYCPPSSSLPSKGNSLKVEWKGQPIDLSNDPHKHLLHPDEMMLAGNLRLDCATYLTSKRRIFDRRLHCLRTGKEFRKTDAQQACKIDVNKASKLWMAFEKVGWLQAHWVRRFL